MRPGHTKLSSAFFFLYTLINNYIKITLCHSFRIKQVGIEQKPGNLPSLSLSLVLTLMTPALSSLTSVIFLVLWVAPIVPLMLGRGHG